jgi:hypothetical protein
LQIVIRQSIEDEDIVFNLEKGQSGSDVDHDQINVELSSVSDCNILYEDENLSFDEFDFVDALNSHLPPDDVHEIENQSKPVAEESNPITSTIANHLKEFYFVNLTISAIEISAPVECPAVLWVEYSLPHSNKDITRFREKLSAPLKIPKTVNVSHSRRESISFTSSVIHIWENETIDIQITAVGNRSNQLKPGYTKTKTYEELWSAFGKVKCRDILCSDGFQWKNEIPMINSKAKSKCRFDPLEIICHLHINIHLTPDLDEIKSDPTDSNTLEKKSTLNAQIEYDQKLWSYPVYLYFDLQEVRGLKFNCPPPHDGILLSLSFRFFDSAQRTRTVPIQWSSEFDIESGKLNQPTRFNFRTIIPLALSKDFLENYGQLPLVIEVHAISNHSSDSDAQDFENCCRSLLGLVKLPFQQVLKAFCVLPGSEQIVHFPQQEYPVIDPFSGNSSGWIQSQMAIGSWANINQIDQSESAINYYSKENTEDPLIEVVQSSKLESDLPHEEQPPPSASEVGAESPVILNDDLHVSLPIDLPSKSESLIQITIHRACGLLGALDDIMDIPSNDDYFEALDFALQSGVNSFCSFDLFPTDSDDFSDDTIQTQLVAYSFTPNYEYSVELTIEALDADLVVWIKNGGCAKGQIWHRIPRHFAFKGRDRVLLGEFSVPLMDLLSAQSGIHKQWFPVGSGRAAVECSLIFKNGFDLCGTLNIQKQKQVLDLDMTVHDINIQYADFVEHGSYVTLKWELPSNTDLALESTRLMLENNGADSYYTTEKYISSCMVDIIDSLSVDGLELKIYSDQSYFGSCFMKISKLIRSARALRRSRNSKLGQPIIEGRYQIINPTSIDLGNSYAHVKLEVKLAKPIKRSYRPSSSLLKENVNPGTFNQDVELVSSIMDKVDLLSIKNERDHNSIEMDSELKLNELDIEGRGSTPIGPDSLELLSKAFHESNEDAPMIPVYISIEKAIHLPLVDDPLADSMKSPFVRQTDIKTTPPSASVSLKCPMGYKEAGQRFFSGAVQSQTCPTWNHQICIHAIRTKENLHSLKSNGSIIFNIWDKFEAENEFLSRSKPEQGRVHLGSCTVSLSPLFSGLSEIHGWYTIKDSDGISRGQLIVKILPLENFGDALSSFDGDFGKRFANSFLVSRKSMCNNLVLSPKLEDSFKPLQDITNATNANPDLDSDATILSKPTPYLIMSKTDFKQSQITERDESISIFNKKENSNKVKRVKETADTWIWNGTDWIHKPVPQNNEEILNSSNPSEPVQPKSIFDTIQELESLKKSMQSKYSKIESQEHNDEKSIELPSKLKSKKLKEQFVKGKPIEECIDTVVSINAEEENKADDRINTTSLNLNVNQQVGGGDPDQNNDFGSQSSISISGLSDTFQHSASSNPFQNTNSLIIEDSLLSPNELMKSERSQNLTPTPLLQEDESETSSEVCFLSEKREQGELTENRKPPLPPIEYKIPWKEIPKEPKREKQTEVEALDSEVNYQRINQIFKKI